MSQRYCFALVSFLCPKVRISGLCCVSKLTPHLGFSYNNFVSVVHFITLFSQIAPWEKEGHKCKNNISGTLAIKVLKEASKFTNIYSHLFIRRGNRLLSLAVLPGLLDASRGRQTIAARKQSLCFLVQFPSNCHVH